MKTLEQWREMLEEYPTLTREQCIVSSFNLYRELRKNSDELEEQKNNVENLQKKPKKSALRIPRNKKIHKS